MSLFSHPDKPLLHHLQEVASTCKSVMSSPGLFEGDRDRQLVLRDLAYLAGAFHDIGKGTRFFQHYLLHPEHEVIGPKNHALISALFVKEAARILLAKSALCVMDRELYCHMAFTAVKRHHGRLLNFGDEMYVDLKNNTNSKDLKLQVMAFDESGISEIIAHFTSALSIQYGLSDFQGYIQSEAFLEDMPEFYEEHFEDSEDFLRLPSEKKLEHYYVHQLLFGALLLADKSDVLLGEHYGQVKRVAADAVQLYKRRKDYDNPKSLLDLRKNEAFDSVLENLDRVFSAENHIYSVTLPTGLGKTITSLAAALRLRELVGSACRRVLICIPFTSIIDQNFEVYRDIVGTSNSDVLLKHHHLSEPEYKMDDAVLDADKGQFLIETWQSEVIVTTFVQLFHSLFSNDKSLLVKIPNLANAVVILDEVQTIPYQYWRLVRNVFQTLGRTYNCYFIMMSATQPLLFRPETGIKELVPDYKRFFGYFNRTRLIVNIESAIGLEAWGDEILRYMNQNPGKDILVILNTRKHSRQLFEQLRTAIDPELEDIYYLSTLITPFERKEIISRVKRHSGRRKVVVSTQLIEAGVDISMDTVFRTLTPIDSIIQAAGRANRYGEKKSGGEVYLYEVEELKKASAGLYGSDLIQKTKNVLGSVKELAENEYLPLIERYYWEVANQSDNYHCDYLDAVTELRFEDVSKFSLIDERNSESVFIQLNEPAKAVWDKYATIYQQPDIDPFEKRRQFSKIKAEFYDYVINVPVPWGKQSIDFDGEQILNFYLSELDHPSAFYSYDASDWSINTGYQAISTLNF